MYKKTLFSALQAITVRLRARGALTRLLAATLTFLLLAAAWPLWADAPAGQKKKKDQPPASEADLRYPMPDPQAIDLMIGEMLGAWQIGDVDMMHKYYADDVAVVSGLWEPPLIGWDNYVRGYKAQRARVQEGRLDRTNTYTKVMGDTAWSTYQWQFSGKVDGQSSTAVGHTTLVLQKRDGNWIIVLNHTSESPLGNKPATAPAAAPGSSAQGK